ncbi:hypothetical protein [Escherichia coli]|uniref:hypothetical protein n=1 Tax=Escherichia coli TaxID=562 RepID=UPI0032D9CB39
MNKIDAVVTKVLDVRPYRNFWITRVEVLSEGGYSNTELINYSERDAREVKPGDSVQV